MKLLNVLFWISSTATALQAEKLTKIPFLSARDCTKEFPCFRIAPDSKDVAVVNPQRHLIIHGIEKPLRFKVDEIQCKDRSCFDFSGNSNWIAYTKLEGEDAALYALNLSKMKSKNQRELLRLADLPRFASSFGSVHHEVNFCGSENTVFVRSGNFNVSEIWVYRINGKSVFKQKLFGEMGGSTSALKCGMDSNSVYFNTRVVTPDAQTQVEDMVLAKAMDSSSSFQNQVLFHEVVSVGDRLITDFLLTWNQLVLSVRNPVWIGERTGSLLTIDKTNQQRFLSTTENRSLRLLGSNHSQVLVENRNEQSYTPSQTLSSISLENGAEVKLTSEGSFLEIGTFPLEIASQTDRVLFAETNSYQRDFVVSRFGGAQRQVVASQAIYLNPEANLPNILRARISPSGRCVMLNKSSVKASGESAELVALDLERTSKVFPLPSLPETKWEFDSQLEYLEFAPNSSYVVIMADPYHKSQFDLYKVPTTVCQ